MSRRRQKFSHHSLCAFTSLSLVEQQVSGSMVCEIVASVNKNIQNKDPAFRKPTKPEASMTMVMEARCYYNICSTQ